MEMSRRLVASDEKIGQALEVGRIGIVDVMDRVQNLSVPQANGACRSPQYYRHLFQRAGSDTHHWLGEH
jgi:hypothetical protein